MLHPAEKSARFKLVFKEKWAKSIWFRTGAIAGGNWLLNNEMHIWVPKKEGKTFLLAKGLLAYYEGLCLL